MNLTSLRAGNPLSLRVIPDSSKTKLIEENNQLKLYLQAQPEDNKANIALIKFFKKEFNLKVSIKSGAKSRNKVIEIL